MIRIDDIGLYHLRGFIYTIVMSNGDTWVKLSLV